MKFKRLTAILLVLAMAAIMAACGSSSQKEGDGTQPEQQTASGQGDNNAKETLI